MLTVYFDTSFYRDLGSLPADEARAIVAGLDEAGVRPAIGPHVFAELAREAERAEAHARAFEHLRGLTHPALELGGGFDWAALGPGPEREQVAATAGATDQVELYLRTICATEPVSDGYGSFLTALLGDDVDAVIGWIHTLDPALPVRAYNAAVSDKIPDVLAALGAVEVGPDLALNQARILRHNAGVVALGLRAAGIEPPAPVELDTSAPSEAFAAYDAWMRAALGPEARDFIGLGRLLTRTEVDPTHARARLAGALADEGHLPVLASFPDAIDLLHVDAHARGRVGEPSHYLPGLGLARRCFHAAGPAEVVAHLRSAAAN